eukprot:ANDGO_00509.mRNA.1 SWIM zinc finger protein
MKIPGVIQSRLQILRDVHFLIIQSYGPTSHILSSRDGTEKFRVSLGSPSACSCGLPKIDNLPCIHMLFILIRLFRVSESSPVLASCSFTERQIEDVLSYRYCEDEHSGRTETVRSFLKKSRSSGMSDGSKRVRMRNPKQVETCVVCLDSIVDCPYSMLTFCRSQCGTPVHIACMRVWCDHRRSLRENITCPMCRAPWASLDPPKIRKQETEKSEDPVRPDDTAQHFPDLLVTTGSITKRSVSAGSGSRRPMKGSSLAKRQESAHAGPDNMHPDLAVDTRSCFDQKVDRTDSASSILSRFTVRMPPRPHASNQLRGEQSLSEKTPPVLDDCVHTFALQKNSEVSSARRGSLSSKTGRLVLGRAFASGAASSMD